MVYLFVGAIGFVIIHLCDPVAIKRLPFLKPLVWVLGIGMVCFAAIMTSISADKVMLPVWSVWLGWTFLAASFFLVIYSLFINLPFHKTYIIKGVGDRLVTTGFYALVRHPGVLWSALLIISVMLVSRSRLGLIAAPLFIILDVILVTIQDRYFFVRMFDGYELYRKETPMFIPNKHSIKNFFNSLRTTSSTSRITGGHNDIELI